jgi:hypothetical protein
MGYFLDKCNIFWMDNIVDNVPIPQEGCPDVPCPFVFDSPKASDYRPDLFRESTPNPLWLKLQGVQKALLADRARAAHLNGFSSP